MSRFLTSFIALTVSILLYSCSEIDNPVANVSDSERPASSGNIITGTDFSDPIPVNNYRLVFNGKTYDPVSDQSTFSYTLNGTGIEPALNNFSLEIPSCSGTPVSYSPTQSAKMNQGSIVWESSIPTDGSAEYSITFSGDHPTGFIDATVDSGNDSQTSEVPGPCKGIFTISGSVFVDGNSNQQRDVTESGIRNVTVNLTDGDGEQWMQLTSATGSYSFTVHTGSNAANFTVSVPETTGDPDDFNEQLFDGYLPTTNPPELTVSVNNVDVAGTDFGYEPRTQKLIQQFEDGTIELNTEEPKFWIKQLRLAKNGTQTAEISAAELQGYLEDIELLLLENPYQFGEDKIGDALVILTRPLRSELEVLLVQLLTAELNVVSGRGSNSLDFDLTLLAFGEAAAAGEAAAISASAWKDGFTDTASPTSFTSDATSLLESYNFSGGGGGVGENK